MVAHICEYTKNHGIVYFKWANCMVCEFRSQKKLLKILKRKKEVKGGSENLVTLPRLARGERQLWDGWGQLPRNLVPAGDQHSTEMTPKPWGQAQPEQRESLQAWAASLKVWDSSWCEGRRQGRRLGRRANDGPNFTSCTAAVVKHKEAAWEESPLGLTTLATDSSLWLLHRDMDVLPPSTIHSGLWPERRFLRTSRLLGCLALQFSPNP